MQNYTNHSAFNINAILPTDEIYFTEKGALMAAGYKVLLLRYLNTVIPTEIGKIWRRLENKWKPNRFQSGQKKRWDRPATEGR